MRGLLLVALLLAAPAGAHAPEEAAALWVEEFGAGSATVGHTPLEHGGQFAGWLTVADGEGGDVRGVDYQVCIVAAQCLISPRPASRQEDGNGTTWQFDTADYRAPAALGGKQVVWRGGTHVGFQFFVHLEGEDEPRPFPRPWGDDDPRCTDTIACSASHYFTFHAGPAPADAAGPAVLAIAAALLVAACSLRRRHGP